MTPKRFSGRIAWIFGVIAALAALVLLWDWNWFRPFVEIAASDALGRPVSIGHFDIELRPDLRIVTDDVTIANPTGFPDEDRFASIRRLSIRLELRPLLHRRIHIPEIAVDTPHFDLIRTVPGKANWRFDAGTDSSGDYALDLGTLKIVDGTAHIGDAVTKSDFNLSIRTLPGDGEKEPRLDIAARGTYADQPITGHFTGGSILTLRDAQKPYPVDLWFANGNTRIALKGSVERPLELAGAHLDLTLQGDDLSRLYPLTAIPFPPSPPYRLTGGLDYVADHIRFRNFAGTVGSSDLSGSLEVDPKPERPMISANLTSNRIILADLAGFIGSTPGKADAANDTPEQKRARTAQDASPRLIPDTPVSLPKLRSADMDITFRGKRIESQWTPLDNITARLTLDNGTLLLHPLTFGVGQGQIVGDIKLDGRQNSVRMMADVDFRRIDLHRIMAATKAFEGTGTIGGHAKIDTTGNSLAQMLAQGDGDFKLFMAGGDMSALLVDLAGLDFGSSLLSMLGLPNRTDIRCMIFDSELAAGVLKTRTFLVDTTEANVIGTGSIDLRKEQIAYQITTDPKHFTIGSIPAPIDVKGAIKNPSIGPDAANVGTRVAAASVLGVLLTPLGALLPTIQLGLGDDNDCRALVSEIRQRTAKSAK